MGRERKVRELLKTVQMTAAKQILRCSGTTSNRVLRAEVRNVPTYNKKET